MLLIWPWLPVADWLELVVFPASAAGDADTVAAADDAADDAPAAETTFDVIMGAFDVATITNAINDVTVNHI